MVAKARSVVKPVYMPESLFLAGVKAAERDDRTWAAWVRLAMKEKLERDKRRRGVAANLEDLG